MVASRKADVDQTVAGRRPCISVARAVPLCKPSLRAARGRSAHSHPPSLHVPRRCPACPARRLPPRLPAPVPVPRRAPTALSSLAPIAAANHRINPISITVSSRGVCLPLARRSAPAALFVLRAAVNNI
ncbi:hypothetical protein K466DRAFT_353897 [Polyporus arcularius HHB13444]|uniref:Uncharacterized protein n=1 Tax=Polyporus arcularius HHB13444 TaxID=1314778 RepID=A0A5C3PZZ4_9APHY|nr:hypothetical protein K466DRAFT_353897 [Polyporus arcularius HHB13444]